jgi:hypothetical protein
MTKQTIPASDEAWDERLLGADEAFVKVAEDECRGRHRRICRFADDFHSSAETAH